MICLSFNNSKIEYNNNGEYLGQKTSKELGSMFWTYGYQEKKLDFKKLHLMINSDYRVYSAGIFTDGYRKTDHWVSQDLLILDVDNDGNEDDMSLQEAYKAMSGFKCLISTTASHQKGKIIGNREVPPSDRYRIIIALTEKISCTAQEYTDAMKLLLNNMFPFADKKCSDPARFYFGASNAEYKYFDGELFDFSEIVIRSKSAIKTKQKIVPMEYKEYTGDNLIDDFNKGNDIRVLLTRYGYIQRGDRFVSPDSSTGDAGVVIYDGEKGDTMAYSHHSSDGWDRAMDSFGIYALKEHGGDMSRAALSLKGQTG